jgi:hypothetical protein
MQKAGHAAYDVNFLLPVGLRPPCEVNIYTRHAPFCHAP